MSKKLVAIKINGLDNSVPAGISVAAAIALSGNICTRISIGGQARAPLCGMGICQECRVQINGRAHQLACQTICQSGMKIETGVTV